MLLLCLLSSGAFAQEEWPSLRHGFRDLKWGDKIDNRPDFTEYDGEYQYPWTNAIDYIRRNDTMRFGNLALKQIVYRTTYDHRTASDRFVGVILYPTPEQRDVLQIISQTLGPPVVRQTEYQPWYSWRFEEPAVVNVVFDLLSVRVAVWELNLP